MKTVRMWAALWVFLWVTACASYHCTATGTSHTELRPIYGFRTIITRRCSYGRRNTVCYSSSSDQPYIQGWYPVTVPDERCTEVK